MKKKLSYLLFCTLMAYMQVQAAPSDDYYDNRMKLLTSHNVSLQTFDMLMCDFDADQKADTVRHMLTLQIPFQRRDNFDCLMNLIGHAKLKTRPFVTSWIQKVFPPEGQNLTSYFAPVQDILKRSTVGLLIRLSEKITLVEPTVADHMALLITMGSIPPEDPDHVMKYVLKIHSVPCTSEDAQRLIKQMSSIPQEDRSPLVNLARNMGLSKMEISDKLFLLDLLKGVKPSMRNQVYAWINDMMPTDFKCVELCFTPVAHALQDPHAETLISWARLLFMSHKGREPNPKNAYDKLMHRNFLAAVWGIEPNKRIDMIARMRIKIQKTVMTHIQLLKILKDMEQNPS